MKTAESRNLMQTFKNHLVINYGEKKTQHKSKDQQTWNFNISQCTRTTTDWRAELELAAHQIMHFAKQDAYLFVDGSYSSQIMAQAFKWAKVPFRCVTPRFKKDLNIHSLSQAVMFFENNDMQYEIIDLDIESVLLSPEAVEWSSSYGTDRPSQILAMKVWQLYAKNNKFLVLPFGLPRFEKDQQGWKVVEHEREYACFQFQADNKAVGIPCFYKWNSEMTSSLMSDPVVRAVVTNLRATNQMTDDYYKEVFGNYFKLTGKNNWNGFEKSTFIVKKYHQKLLDKNEQKLTAYAFHFADYCARIEYRVPQVPNVTLAPVVNQRVNIPTPVSAGPVSFNKPLSAVKNDSKNKMNGKNPKNNNKRHAG